ncbi:universal stress protein [Edwardsiella piscicida]
MYKTILVPIDLTEDNMSRLVIPHVENFARQEDAHIHFLAVLPPLSSFYGMGSLPVGHYPSEKDRLQHAEAGLRQVAAQFNLPEDRVHCTIAIGAPRDRILLQAEEIGADLIIVASPGHHHLPARVDGRVGRAPRVYRRTGRTLSHLAAGVMPACRQGGR